MLLGSFLALAALGSVELAARGLRSTAAAGGATAGETWSRVSPELGWVGRAGLRQDVLGGPRRFGADGFLIEESSSSPPSGPRRRILLLGDSRTFGFGVAADETFGRALSRLLDDAVVFNRALPGYSSYQGLVVLRDAVERLRPSAVVFAFGLNDRRYVLGPEKADGPVAFAAAARSSRRWGWLRSLAIADLVARARSSMGRPLDLTTVVPRVAPADYRRHLRAAAAICAERGIPLIVLLLGDNPDQSRDLEEGVRALEEQRLADGERLLRQAIEPDNAFSDAARLRLVALRALHSPGPARDDRTLRSSPRVHRSQSGGSPILAHRVYRELTFRLARQLPFTVVDVESAFREGPHDFFDFCHFGPAGHLTVARRLADILRRLDSDGALEGVGGLDSGEPSYTRSSDMAGVIRRRGRA